MSFSTCCVPGCMIKYGEGVPLHCFPNPGKDYERFHLWVKNIGTSLVGLEDMYIFANRRVCRRHFLPIHLYPKNRLSKLAVPALHIPEHTIEASGNEGTPMLENNISMPSTSWAVEPTTFTIGPNLNTPTCPASMVKTNFEKSAMNRKQRGPKICCNDVAIKKEIISLKRKVARITKVKNQFKRRLSLSIRSSLHTLLENANMSAAAKTFVTMQISQSRKKSTGRRFTLDEKILALSLYKPSPKAYRILSEICILPKRKTLQRLLQKVTLTPGFNSILFDNLKAKIQKMPKSHRYCTLIFDEMAISAGLSYDKKGDLIIGFNDDGDKRAKIFCDHVLVLMIRGVVKKFKQPILYSYCSGTTKTLDLKKTITKTITILQECGLTVVATICDQGATNLAAINALLKDTKSAYLKNNEEYKGIYFEVNGKQIYPIFDPPHLIKGIRNNLITKNLKYNKENRQRIAKWSHIQELYKRSPGYKGVKLVPKLTASHVIPSLIPKMKVKHCTQVFSHSVGVALGFMADAGILPEECTDTADILIFFDNLFDSVNGSYSNIQGGKIYRSAVTRKSPHQKLWSEAIPILKSMKFVDNHGKETVVPSLSSWIKTIENFRDIVKNLHNKGLNSLLLRHFNQDPLENFFGAIRAHGQSNIMPNAAAFENAYKTLLINNISSPHSVGANCENDKGKCLQNLKFFFSLNSEIIEQGAETEIEEGHLNIILCKSEVLIHSDKRNDVERCAALGYCSGWLVKMAKTKIFKNCKICVRDLESATNDDFHKYIKIREYCNKNWLCYPTKAIFDVFLHIETITMEILKTRPEKKLLTDYIKLIVAISIDFSFLNCTVHREQIITFVTNKCIAFFVHNWCKEINSLLNKKNLNWDNTDPFKTAAATYAEKKSQRKK